MPSTEAGKRLYQLWLTGSDYDTLDPKIVAAIAAIEAEAREQGYALAVEMERAVAASERAALLAELAAGVAHQHRRVETVTQDGDDWIGCLCGEPDDNCAVLAALRAALRETP